MKEKKIWKFGNDIDTDQIIGSQYLLLPKIKDMIPYVFESIDKDFSNIFISSGVIVAGSNFGCGSSREQAPRVLKELGVSVVIARSFARIFFRNSINIGLPLIICNDLYDKVIEGESLSFSFEKGEIYYKDGIFNFNKFPKHILKIIECNGLIEYINKE